MTNAEKWAKHTELVAKADELDAEWRKTCQEINDLLMTRPADLPPVPGTVEYDDETELMQEAADAMRNLPLVTPKP